jgi:hypothetical protein
MFNLGGLGQAARRQEEISVASRMEARHTERLQVVLIHFYGYQSICLAVRFSEVFQPLNVIFIYVRKQYMYNIYFKIKTLSLDADTCCTSHN